MKEHGQVYRKRKLIEDAVYKFPDVKHSMTEEQWRAYQFLIIHNNPY